MGDCGILHKILVLDWFRLPNHMIMESIQKENCLRGLKKEGLNQTCFQNIRERKLK
jgi:hypothetical protein